MKTHGKHGAAVSAPLREETPMHDKPKRLRGFAAIKAKDPERQRAIAAKGGAAMRAEDRPFAKDPDLAAAAGRKGGTNGKGGGRPGKERARG